MNLNLYDLLQKHFSYDTFHDGQEEIIRDVLDGKNVLGMLKTGSGKSLCYQLPAKILPHITVVVSPLISLMIDQVREAKAFKFKEVAALHSMQSWEERQYILRHLHLYKLLYISPELIQQPFIIDTLKRRKVSLFVVDEAHCISQWGHDFRPDYLRLKQVIDALEKPPILALTGTATPEVQTDIQEQLHVENMTKHLYPIDRENIALCVEHVVNDQDKLKKLMHLLTTYKLPTIIYFSSRKMTEQIAQSIQGKMHDRSIAFYHGGMDTVDRLKVQQQFLHNQLDIICCTSAFGMGINKKNIRLVIHYHMPSDIESFIQEIGRAGRDGKQSVSVVLYKDGDIQMPLQMVESDLPSRQELIAIKEKLEQLKEKHILLPTKDEEIERVFQMKAGLVHFVYYQLQARHMMNHDYMIESLIPASIWRDMEGYIQKRIQLKRQKAFELQAYMDYDRCLREKLYRHFDQTIQELATTCCKHCGFKLENWEIEHDEVLAVQPSNWLDQLKTIFLIKD